MEIKTLDELKTFIEESNSIKSIEKVVSASLGVYYIISEENTLEEVKRSTIEFIENYKDNSEIPIFLITYNL